MRQLESEQCSARAETSRQVISLSTLTAFVTFAAIVSCGVLAGSKSPTLAVLPLAFLLGWVEVDGQCGTSHVGAITPLRELDRTGRLWKLAVAAYLGGGVLTSAWIGLCVGTLGSSLKFMSPWLLASASMIALILVFQQTRLLNFVLPQVRRQTNPDWRQHYGFVAAAAMWGAHIGIGFATVIAHGGIYILTLVALALNPILASAIFVAFWIGRTLPIVSAPWYATDSRFANQLFDDIDDASTAQRYAAVAGFVGMIGLITLLL